MKKRMDGTAGWVLCLGIMNCWVASAVAQEAPIPAAPLPGTREAVSEAASSDPGELGEIVVTAQKRSESLQKVPIAISAFGSDQLEKSHITNIQGLAGSVPNVNFGQYNGNAQISVRGLGYDSINPGAEGRVALHVNGIYMSRPGAGTGAFFDVDRIEVLRGPQGTLYGRNATAGSVNIISKMPTDTFSGYLRQTVGNYSDFISEAAVSGPISDAVAVRLAGRMETRHGYGTNIVTGNDIDNVDTRSLRGTVQIKPSTDFTLVLSGDYHHENDRNNTLLYLGQRRPDLGLTGGLGLGGRPAPNARDVALDVDPYNKRTYWGGSATATLNMNDFTLKSITGYRNSKYNTRGSFDAISGNFNPYTQFEKSRTISEELQLTYDHGSLKALLGAFYFHEKGSLATEIVVPNTLVGVPGPFRQLQGYLAAGTFRSDAAAIFGQLTYSLTPKLSVTLGERFGYERKAKNDFVQFDLSRDYNPNNPPIKLATPVSGYDSTHDYYHSPKLSINYELNPKALLFASYGQGYKSGGYDIGTGTASYKPETVKDYEVGLKAQWLDNKLRTNLSAFYYDYTNIQLSVNRNVSLATENAATATLYGVEAEITALPAAGVELGFNGGWLHSEYKGYRTIDAFRTQLGTLDLSGNQMLQAPKFNSDVSAQYRWSVFDGGEASLRADWKYKSKVYFTAFNIDSMAAPAHSTFDLSLNVKDESGRWSGTIFGRNITNERVKAFTIGNSEFEGFIIIGTYEPPAVYGATVSYNF